MRFRYECDGMDGLILIDENYLDEIDDVLLNKLDILLDRNGKSELVYDFPNEKWEDVWKRETKEVFDFCNLGKMVIFLHCEDEDNCEIIFSDIEHKSKTCIDIKSGKLILVNASELIQCLAYPDLEMETLLEIDNLDAGVYSIQFDGINYIQLRKDKLVSEMNNVIELF